MIVAGRLRRLREHPDRGGIAADVGQGQCNAEFHRMPPQRMTLRSFIPVLCEDEPSP